MFKPSSGRKVESGMWEYFVYEGHQVLNVVGELARYLAEATNFNSVLENGLTWVDQQTSNPTLALIMEDLVSAPASQAYRVLTLVWCYRATSWVWPLPTSESFVAPPRMPKPANLFALLHRANFLSLCENFYQTAARFLCCWPFNLEWAPSIPASAAGVPTDMLYRNLKTVLFSQGWVGSAPE